MSSTGQIVLPPLAWKETPNQSARRGHVSLVVVHRWACRAVPDELRTYKGVIAHLCDPAVQASAHVVYAGGEENQATQLVAWDRKAWSCEHYNSPSDSLECADDIWAGMDHLGFAVAARIVAFRCHVRNLPPVWVHGEALVAGHKGVTRHYDLGALGGGHTDPTTDDALWEAFMARVKYEFKRGGFRHSWGK